jgi:hypothetical protein
VSALEDLEEDRVEGTSFPGRREERSMEAPLMSSAVTVASADAYDNHVHRVWLQTS